MRPILLVEDGVNYFDTLRWTLRRAGYMADAVCGGQEALDYLRAADPVGLVILHCRRPDAALLDRLKLLSQAPVVVVAGDGPAPGEADFFLGTPAAEEHLLAVARAFYQPRAAQAG